MPEAPGDTILQSPDETVSGSCGARYFELQFRKVDND